MAVAAGVGGAAQGSGSRSADVAAAADPAGFLPRRRAADRRAGRRGDREGVLLGRGDLRNRIRPHARRALGALGRGGTWRARRRDPRPVVRARGDDPRVADLPDRSPPARVDCIGRRLYCRVPRDWRLQDLAAAPRRARVGPLCATRTGGRRRSTHLLHPGSSVSRGENSSDSAEAVGAARLSERSTADPSVDRR